MELNGEGNRTHVSEKIKHVVTDLSGSSYTISFFFFLPAGAWRLRHGWLCVKYLKSFSPLVFEQRDPWQLYGETFGRIRSDSIGMKRWLQAVKTVMIRLSSGRLSHPQLVTYVTDTRGWMIRLLPTAVSPAHHSFHMPPTPLPLLLLLLLHLPHAIGGSLLSPHTVEESDCHTGLWYLQGPSVVAGQPGFHAASREHQARAGRPTGWLDDFGLCSQLQNWPEIGFVSTQAAGLSRYRL